jgi:hypothetical protein
MNLTSNKQSAVLLGLVCLLAMLFFIATDPRAGLLGDLTAANAVDTLTRLTPGTLVGLAGSAILLLVAVYLLTRRTVQ